MILPQKYPYQAPILQIIKAQVVHKYLDDGLRVTHPVVLQWSAKSSLLETIKKIHQEFNTEPPQLAKNSKKQEEAKQSSHIQKLDMGKINKALEDLSTEEMKTLLSDDAFFNDFVMNLEGVRDLGT